MNGLAEGFLLQGRNPLFCFRFMIYFRRDGGDCRKTDMNKNKRIAVVMCSVVFHEYQHRILDGLISQATALGYDVVVFTMFLNYNDSSPYRVGEKQIFSLINYEMFDAVIYAPCSIGSDTLQDMLEADFVQHCKVPVISVESDLPDFQNIPVNDTDAFEQVVTHLIEVHKCRDILCLTGFQGNLQAEMRQQGYRNAMAKHGLPVPEGAVIYGDFWKDAALRLAQDIADGRICKPEAIVCAGDITAVTLCNRLIELGLRVPEDIIVTGYDFSRESEDNVPSVTSYVRPLVQLGIQAVLRAHTLITGETAEPVRHDEGFLIPAESCGCGDDFYQKFANRQAEIKHVEYYRSLFEDCAMAETLNASGTLNECLGKIAEHLYLIDQLRDFYLCLCDQWDDFSRNDIDNDDYKQYADTMHLRIASTDCATSIVDIPFPRAQLLPLLHEAHDTARAYYVTPLHFNERCFGYCMMGYGAEPKAFNSLYHSWMRNVNNALEFIRVRNIFNSMNQRLYMASIRDTLTGVFNRKGFKYYSTEIFERAKSTGKRLLIMAADLDCLKVINDTYGHLEGDAAITIVANALNTCCENGEICARTGGDEFLIMGCSDYQEEQLQKYVDYIRSFCERFNAGGEKPYSVGTSIGYICRTITQDDVLQNLIDEADARMYENKVLRKKQRQ